MRRLPAALLALVAAFTLWVVQAKCESYRLMWDSVPDVTEYRVTCRNGASETVFVNPPDTTYIRLNGKLVEPGEYTCEVVACNDFGCSDEAVWSTVVIGEWAPCCDVRSYRAIYTRARSEWSEDGRVATTHSITRAVQGERRCE